jgi:hypothetical protein
MFRILQASPKNNDNALITIEKVLANWDSDGTYSYVKTKKGKK